MTSSNFWLGCLKYIKKTHFKARYFIHQEPLHRFFWPWSLVITIDCITFYKRWGLFFCAPLGPRNLWRSILSKCIRISETCIAKWMLSVVVSRSSGRVWRRSISDVRGSGGGLDCSQVCDKTRTRERKEESEKGGRKSREREQNKNKTNLMLLLFLYC